MVTTAMFFDQKEFHMIFQLPFNDMPPNILFIVTVIFISTKLHKIFIESILIAKYHFTKDMKKMENCWVENKVRITWHEIS